MKRFFSGNASEPQIGISLRRHAASRKIPSRDSVTEATETLAAVRAEGRFTI